MGVKMLATIRYALPSAAPFFVTVVLIGWSRGTAEIRQQAVETLGGEGFGLALGRPPDLPDRTWSG